jgi:hypothetical protein
MMAGLPGVLEAPGDCCRRERGEGQRRQRTHDEQSACDPEPSPDGIVLSRGSEYEHRGAAEDDPEERGALRCDRWNAGVQCL